MTNGEAISKKEVGFTPETFGAFLEFLKPLIDYGSIRDINLVVPEDAMFVVDSDEPFTVEDPTIPHQVNHFKFNQISIAKAGVDNHLWNMTAGEIYIYGKNSHDDRTRSWAIVPLDKVNLRYESEKD
jgi:hypothetical protein